MAKVIKIEFASTHEAEGKTAFAVFTIAKGENPLQRAALNGDAATYTLPVDMGALGLSGDDAKTPAAMLAAVQRNYIGTEIEGLRLYDIPTAEIGYESVTVVGRDDLQPVTIFRRASFSPREVVVSRLKAQVAREIAQKVLSGEQVADVEE